MGSLNRLKAALAVLLWVCVWASARAQTPPTKPPPGAVPTPEQLRPKLPAAKADASALPDTPAPPRELGKPDDEIVLDVAAYSVDASAPAVLRAALPALTAPYVGKQRSYEDLVNAAAAVTRFLQREMGYYLGYAYLPEQVPENGVIRLAVLEGRLDEVQLVWPEKMPVRREVVEAYLARLKPGEVLRVRDVERIVFLVNDLRGITARFEVKAGRLPGTASLVVTPQPEDRITSRAEVDTLGSRYSGVARASLLSTISSPLGRGDGLVLNVLSSFSRGLEFGLAGYTLPLGSDGFKLGTSVSLVRYQLDKDLLNKTDLNGNGNTVTLYGLYPVVRSRNLNLFSLVSLDAKTFNDRNIGGLKKKKVTDLTLSASGDLRDDWLSGGVNTYEAGLVLGHYKVESGVRPDDVPQSYRVLRLNATRLQNLVDNRLLLYAAIKAQFAQQNLDSSAQFALGGADRVRAFAPGEGTGDEGLTTTFELRFLPPEAWFGRISRELVFSAFFDAGTVRQRHSPKDIGEPVDNVTTLSGWGVGAVWDRPRDFALRAYLAWPASGTAVSDPQVKKPRLYFTANKTF